jgi:hypothetical protein
MNTLKRITLLFSVFILPLCAQAKEGAHHFPEIFLGLTHVGDETDFTYALEYEYKFTEQYGAGIIYEKTDGAHHSDGMTVKIAAVYYHPIPSLRFGVGYGEEKIGGYHPHSEDLFRITGSYDYHLDSFSIAPTLAIDFVGGKEAIVLGIGFIKPF